MSRPERWLKSATISTLPGSETAFSPPSSTPRLLSPSDSPLRFAPNTAAALMIGGGGATRAAIFAMNQLGAAPIFLINRDPTETAAIIAQFPDLDLRALETVKQVEEELAALEGKGIRLAAGTGAIPSIEPQSDAEKNVYEVAKAAFSYPYKSGSTADDGFISLPAKPTFLGASKPPRHSSAAPEFPSRSFRPNRAGRLTFSFVFLQKWRTNLA
jgi:hypothetical protein